MMAYFVEGALEISNAIALIGAESNQTAGHPLSIGEESTRAAGGESAVGTLSLM